MFFKKISVRYREDVKGASVFQIYLTSFPKIENPYCMRFCQVYI